MNKQDLLQELSKKISTGELSREEVISRLGGSKHTHESSHFSVTKMLYVLGASVVLIGIIIFIAQIWDDIGSLGRIVITLGLGLMFTAIGSDLLKKKPKEKIGSVFHIIGGLLIPGGALVTLSELNTGVVSLWPVAITFGVIFGFYLLLNSIHKNAVLTFFAIANGTAFAYLTVESIIAGPAYMHEDLYAYLTMMIGVSYLLLAHSFRGSWNRQLIKILHFVGTTGFLAAAFSRVDNSLLWEMLYFLIVMGGLFLSTRLKSGSILVMSTIFLIIHVSYITSEHFANSLGWPISLVVLGFVFIGLGYASITINKRYIKN